jgi:hypothetical protein
MCFIYQMFFYQTEGVHADEAAVYEYMYGDWCIDNRRIYELATSVVYSPIYCNFMLQLVMLHLRKRSEPNQAFFGWVGRGGGGGD